MDEWVSSCVGMWIYKQIFGWMKERIKHYSNYKGNDWVTELITEINEWMKKIVNWRRDNLMSKLMNLSIEH